MQRACVRPLVPIRAACFASPQGEGEGEDEDDVPEVPLEELLDDLAAMHLEEEEEEGAAAEQQQGWPGGGGGGDVEMADG